MKKIINCIFILLITLTIPLTTPITPVSAEDNWFQENSTTVSEEHIINPFKSQSVVGSISDIESVSNIWIEIGVAMALIGVGLAITRTRR